MYETLRDSLCLAVACGLWACKTGSEQTPPLAEAKPSTHAAEAPAPAEASAPSPEPAPGEEPNPRAVGWDKLRFEDEVPLCVFSDHEHRDAADFLKDVRKQTLKANTQIVFGAFAPDCMAEACHAVPTLQCWVEPGTEPNALIVHSRFSYEHKQGSVCTTDCRPITAGCETPLLKAGTYSVTYGARVFKVRIPSVVSKPCELK